MDGPTLGAFAAAQAEYLCSRLGLASLDELAHINVLKLGEETGEVNSAYLALLGHQRAEKLTGTAEDRLAALSREIGDVIATAAILAHALNLDIDAALATRLTELEARRLHWLTDPANPGTT